MLKGATFRACAMAGTAVLRIVVSKDSMKKATATSHGNNFLLAAASDGTVVVSDMSRDSMLTHVDGRGSKAGRSLTHAALFPPSLFSSFDWVRFVIFTSRRTCRANPLVLRYLSCS